MDKKKEESSKQRILKAATKLFSKKGFDGTSIREICQDANVNVCMISYFWGGKQELYKGIVDDLIEKQTQYAKTFMNIEKEPSALSTKEQIELLYTILDKAIEFLYGESISDDLFRFLLQEQQNRHIEISSPVFIYIRKLIAAIFDKNLNDKDIIYNTVFIMSQINSPKVLPAFSLNLLNQKSFEKDDMEIIKKNTKLYIKALLEENNIKV